MYRMQDFVFNEDARCYYDKCSCQESSNVRSVPQYKPCSACGIVSYCSKLAQTKDWPRHKKVCSHFRPFKHMAGDLLIRQKLPLNNISLELPSIADEYRKKYPGVIALQGALYATPLDLFIRGAVQTTRKMVSSNLRRLAETDDDRRGMLKRWQESLALIDDFTYRAKLGEVFKEKAYVSYNPRAPQQFRNTPLAEPTSLVNGRSIVDIGFVDFGITFDCIDSIDFDGEPVTVLAYDMHPFCVAKSMVMHTYDDARQTSSRSYRRRGVA